MNLNGSATKTGYPVRYFDQHQAPPPPPPSNSGNQAEQSAYGNYVAYPPTSAYMQNQSILGSQQQFDNAYNQTITDYATNQYFNQPYQHSTPANKVQPSPKRNIKKKAPYSKPSNANLFYCELCKISCAGEQPYKLHCEGQKHRKKELNSQNASSNATGGSGAQKSNYYCELCSAPCSGIDSFNAHLNGKSHIKACNLQVELGKEVPANLVAPIMKQSAGIGANTAKSVNPFASILASARAPASISNTTSTATKVIGTPVINFIKGGSLKTMTSDSDAVIEELKDEKPSDSNQSIEQQISNDNNGNLQEMTDQSVLEDNKSTITSTETTSQINSFTNNDNNSIQLLGETLENTKLNTSADQQLGGEPIGEDFITEYTMSNSKAIFYSCSLCDCKFSEITAKEQHVRGKRHHKNYRSQDRSNNKINRSPIAQTNTASPEKKFICGNSLPLRFLRPSLLSPAPRSRPPSFSQLLPGNTTSPNKSTMINNRIMDSSSFTNQSVSMNSSMNSANGSIDENYDEFQTNMDLFLIESVESKFQSMDNRYLGIST